MISKETVTTLIEQHLAGSSHFLVDVTIRSGNRITVFLDGDLGISIETCREVNHFLNQALDRDLEDYDLTVSSAGADQPLKMPRQYMKNKGKQLEVVTNEGKKFTGIVLEADEDSVTLQAIPQKKRKPDPEVAPGRFLYRNIRTATEVITFKQ